VIGLSGETPITFGCGGDTLVGVLHRPASAPSLGMVLVVGGPQYRVGSHRQFVLLARSLASRGVAVLRFDCRGMGDSDGEFQGFERIEPDIAAAVNTIVGELPSLRQVALWGLCDATLGICAHARRDPRIAGVALVNPWVRSEGGYARTQLKHYYLGRLGQRDFRRKLFSGEFNPVKSARSLWANIAQAITSTSRRGGENELARTMAADLREFTGRILLILSGHDLTAKEFDEAIRTAKCWQWLCAEPHVTRRDLLDADHTFSRAVWRDQVAAWTLDWLKEIASP
jgi:uncharacterized protein